METHLGSLLAAGVDPSVRDAMGWDAEDRGVVTAADVEQLLPPPPQSATAAATAAGKNILYPSVAGTSSAADGNDEEILLDYDDDEEEVGASQCMYVRFKKSQKLTDRRIRSVGFA